MLFLAGFLILIFSIILHEVAHGLTAERLGDPTARLAGRLTLNPLSHIDPLMSILLPLLLIISGSPVIFASAKPVSIDPFNFRDDRKDMGLVGLAGPAINMALAVSATLLYKILLLILPATAGSEFSYALFRTAVFYNLLLAAFNLIPIPPLDGSRILAAVLSEEKARLLAILEPFGMFIVFFLLLFPLGGFSLATPVFNLVSFWMRVLGF
jgi:Zn-dependent protease